METFYKVVTLCTSIKKWTLYKNHILSDEDK